MSQTSGCLRLLQSSSSFNGCYGAHRCQLCRATPCGRELGSRTLWLTGVQRPAIVTPSCRTRGWSNLGRLDRFAGVHYTKLTSKAQKRRRLIHPRRLIVRAKASISASKDGGSVSPASWPLLTETCFSHARLLLATVVGTLVALFPPIPSMLLHGRDLTSYIGYSTTAHARSSADIEGNVEVAVNAQQQQENGFWPGKRVHVVQSGEWVCRTIKHRHSPS